MTDKKLNEQDLTEQEFLDSQLSKDAVQLMSIYIEPDNEMKTVLKTDDVDVMLRIYSAFIGTINSMPDVLKAIMAENIEKQKQQQLNKILKEREESDV